GVSTGLSKQITPGKRAMAISVSDTNAVSRLLKPGDRIDLVATIDPPGAGKGGLITKIVLQDVPVLSVGEYVTSQAPRKVEKDDSTGKDYVRNLNIERNFSTITIEVEPRVVPQITLLQDSGVAKLSVALRHNDDTERLSLGGTTLLEVLGSDASKISRFPASQR
ncbi:MAG: Flp pilus assembly protein CpaB, partial [Bdellovibrionota bacterium]